MKPSFDAAFRAQFRDLVLWRRDVRRFRRDPLPRERIDTLIEIATHAPSVGLSQPWRFVHVDSPERRLAVIKSFTDANERALAGYSGEKQETYAGLKLAGLKEAPVHLAVLSDDGTHTGSGHTANFTVRCCRDAARRCCSRSTRILARGSNGM